MIRILGLASAVILIACAPVLAQSGFDGRPITTNAFTETGYTLHRDEFAIGIGPIEYGIGENVQLGTNLFLWALQVYNADLKIAVTKRDGGALSAGFTIYNLSLKHYDTDDESEGNYLAFAPYLAGSYRLTDNTMAHASARYAYFEAEEEGREIEDTEPDEISSGTAVYVGLEHSRSNRTKFLVDGGYDATFEGFRVGGAVLFGWTRFRLKLGLSYFGAGDGFFFPIVGLWWRFQA